VGTDKRDRQKAGRVARLEEAHRQYRKQQRKRRLTIGFVTVAALALLLLGLSFLFRDDGDDVATSSSTTTTPTFPTTTAVPITAVPAGESITGETPCPPVDSSAARTTTFENPPPTCIDPALTYTALVSTTKGDFTVTLDQESAPLAANNFVVLARYHYYDGVPFHRLVPGFLVQAGDATGDPLGSGDPGYELDADENPADLEAYQAGSVASATAGSQFFVYLGPTPLDGPDYPIFGQVTSGLDVVRTIARAGTPDQAGTAVGTPLETVVINSVTITEG
jgi:cyclophilin family peptidyl-prolyl cis-trans isomerase